MMCGLLFFSTRPSPGLLPVKWYRRHTPTKPCPEALGLFFRHVLQHTICLQLSLPSRNKYASKMHASAKIRTRVSLTTSLIFWWLRPLGYCRITEISTIKKWVNWWVIIKANTRIDYSNQKLSNFTVEFNIYRQSPVKSPDIKTL